MSLKNISNKKGRKIKAKDKLYYSSKEYVNPFFQERKLKRKKAVIQLSSRFKFYAYSIGIVSILLLIYLIYGPYFKIDNVIIEGQGHIDKKTLEEISWQQINNNFLKLYPQNNIFLFRINKLEENLSKKYAFNSLSIKRIFPDTIKIDYKEKTYVAIFSENEDYFYIDMSGYVIAVANLMEVSERDYPIIKNNSSNNISDNHAPINEKAVTTILDIFKKFKEFNSQEYKMERFFINDEINTIQLKLTDGPVLIFSSQVDISSQIEKLLIIKDKKLQGVFNTKEYIDLRYGSSVYYR
jgi:cell division septal protein FtsQ